MESRTEKTSKEVDIPNPRTNGTAGHVDSAYITPQSKYEVSASPHTDSPSSFHTPEQIDYDYQQDVNSEIEPSPPDPSHLQFYSDGRPRPLDSESRDFDSGGEDVGYVTATQITTDRYVDPDQPKLLLADDEPAEPLDKKVPLHNGPGQFRESINNVMASNAAQPREKLGDEHHEQLHQVHNRGHGQQARARASNQETTPLLEEHRERERETDKSESTCCTLL